MSSDSQRIALIEPLDQRCLFSVAPVVPTADAALNAALAAAAAAMPHATPALLGSALPKTNIGFSVETDIPALKQLPTSEITGALNGVVPPVQADLLTQPADFAELGLSAVNRVVPPVFSDAVTNPTDFSQIDTDQPQRVNGRITSLYPLTAEDVYVGYAEVPHSNTGLGLGNNGITSGNVGLAADAIEADLGGAGLEV